MVARTFAEHWKPRSARSADRHTLPDGPLGVLIVLAAWLAIASIYELGAGLAGIGAAPGVRLAGPVVLFTIALAWIRVVRSAEVRRVEAARRQAREFVFARRRALLGERSYFVTDVIGEKRGPYSLDALVRWRERGKLDESAVVYIGGAAEPVPFSRVAVEWREQWGYSAFDPPALRRAG